MPRKVATKTAENTTQAIADALDTPLNLEWDATAEKLMVSVPELQERMACKLDDTVFTWGTIPAEHQPVVDAVSRDLDAERSIRSFGEEREPAAQLPPVTEETELPVVQEQAKHDNEGSALTEKKTQAIKETREAATQTNAGISETLTLLQAQQGLTGLKQISSPNKAQTRFVSHEYVTIVVQPLDKTKRHRCPKRL